MPDVWSGDSVNMTDVRFWSKVDVLGPAECWPWKRATRGGYGRIWCPQEQRVAQSTYYLYKYVLGQDVTPGRTGTVFRHTCDNPPCCNPSHIIPGTTADNVNDKCAKGRHHYQKETCIRGHNRWSTRVLANGRQKRTCLDCRRKIRG